MPEQGPLSWPWYQHLKWGFNAQLNSTSIWFNLVHNKLSLCFGEDGGCFSHVSGRSASPAAWSWKGFLLCGLVASALFQTDLLPSWICVGRPSVQPRAAPPKTVTPASIKNTLLIMISSWSLSHLSLCAAATLSDITDRILSHFYKIMLSVLYHLDSFRKVLSCLVIWKFLSFFSPCQTHEH